LSAPSEEAFCVPIVTADADEVMDRVSSKSIADAALLLLRSEARDEWFVAVLSRVFAYLFLNVDGNLTPFSISLW
jgi:hypothetical protein